MDIPSISVNVMNLRDQMIDFCQQLEAYHVALHGPLPPPTTKGEDPSRSTDGILNELHGRLSDCHTAMLRMQNTLGIMAECTFGSNTTTKAR